MVQAQTQVRLLLQVAGEYIARGSGSDSGSGARITASGRQVRGTRLRVRLRFRSSYRCKEQASIWHTVQTQAQEQVRVLLQVADKYMACGSDSDSGDVARVDASGRQVHATQPVQTQAQV